MINISIIAAISYNYIIGKNNSIPWYLSNDMKFFKKVTLGKNVLMGRKTFDSIGNKALPGRNMIILSHYKKFYSNCIYITNIKTFMKNYQNQDIIIAGGSQIYRIFMPIATTLYITKVECYIDGDAKFPKFSLKEWNEISKKRFMCNLKNEYSHTFHVYKRKK